MRWDIFCRIIDNHGDLGVCWRLAADLATRGETVRLWVDEPAALAWMAPQVPAGITVVHWRQAPSVQGAVLYADGRPLADAVPGDVLVEAFGCEIDPEFAARQAPAAASDARRNWINLEYLSAESYVERSHGLPSPVMAGPAQGRLKHFFYPGFTERTGGLLREADLPARQAGFDRTPWLAGLGVHPAADERVVTLFCYEPAALVPWLQQLRTGPGRTRLLVTPGRAQAAVRAAPTGDPAAPSHLTVTELPYLPQPDFDALLWSGDLNLVRGEDSLVRALWAGRPFVWHIYPQDDGAHWAKLEAFLDLWLDGAPAPLATRVRAWHRCWNADRPQRPETAPPPPGLDDEALAEWREWALLARERLWRQDDLAGQLIRFIKQTG
ncbi:putative repeat protein (TIGR03837 family) [Comamonas sp. BIGb0124]|uniref:elongation factor P maturation arginine rhamnosyltransferase EarP n=1 Tax=Comamonas sp. BIGb0124 TaxID=2485130 RepID=UPI000F490A99|nr:elongation factor P maturation arginine rhamnosyltransferase EarP [Comamonas sp. BIGb0124]ROR18011.1 putative repeat protein (TIGR03837 family) [Comamonas sp. BIGb0124]